MPQPSDAPAKRAAPRQVPAVLWTPLLVRLVVAGIYLGLSERVTIGPRWLQLALVVVLFVPINLARVRAQHHLARLLTLSLAAGSALLVAGSAGLLISQLLDKGIPATQLLQDGTLIWLANLLVFALWYWQLDAHGPDYRHQHHYCTLADTDFLFPQQQVERLAQTAWTPGFVDYLFVAFNASTAFSPTDTLVLSRRAKLLMMAQSLLSVVVLAVLVARAINTLGSG